MIHNWLQRERYLENGICISFTKNRLYKICIPFFCRCNEIFYPHVSMSPYWLGMHIWITHHWKPRIIPNVHLRSITHPPNQSLPESVLR